PVNSACARRSPAWRAAQLAVAQTALNKARAQGAAPWGARCSSPEFHQLSAQVLL
ncbi:hypothetical protein A2U01_0113509, partial [Trifolium medium]|nr:hypothetical protein [Trifolium medium]